MAKSSHNSVSDLILRKFEELIQVFGIKPITIDMIAEKCGISKKTVYKYFHSKHDMVAVIINNILDQLADEMAVIDASGETPAVKLEQLFGSLYNLIGSISVPMLHDIQLGYPEINSRVDEFIDSHREMIRRSIAHGIECGDFYTDINPDIATEIAMSGAERIISSDYILRHNLTIEQTITSFKNFMAHALLKK